MNEKHVPTKLQATSAGLIFILLAGLSSAQDFRSPLILSPYSLPFGEVLIGKPSLPQTVTLVNMGLVNIQINMIDVVGDFSQTNDCPKPPAFLAKNQTCTIQITFKPSNPGPTSGTLTVSPDACSNPLKVALSGNGTLGVPMVQISQGLEFPEQRVGTASSPQTITMSNVGKRALFISRINIDGDFTIMPSSTCETLQGSLASDSSCTVVVYYFSTPPNKGRRSQMGLLVSATGASRRLRMLHSPPQV